MPQNNNPRRPPADSSWFARNQALLLTLVLLALVAGAFAVGRRSRDDLGGSPQTAAPDQLANATIPPTITHVPTSAPRPTAEIAPPTPVPSPTPIIITDAGALRRIESTQILQTTVFRIDTLVRAKKEGSWFFNWGGQNLLLFVKGKVIAGGRSERIAGRQRLRLAG
jgi:hypothetical protein